MRPPQRPPQAEPPPGRPAPGEPPPVPPRRPPGRPPRHVAPEPGPGTFGQRQPGDVPPGAHPERPARPPVRPPEAGPRRRRRPPNDGVPPDENPTDVLDLGQDLFADADPRDDEYDDLVDEEITGRYYGGVNDADADDGDGEDDDEDGFFDDERAEPEYFGDDRDDRRPRRRGRRLLGWVAALAVIALLGAGAFYGARELLGFGYDDYEGAGERDVVLQVEDGDSTRAIGVKLTELDVVASTEAFITASQEDERILGIQPGFYVVKTKMSGANAVERLVQPDARVGELQLRPGTQLDDIEQPDGTVVDGVFTQLSKASCAELNGESTCVPVKRLREVAATTDLAELGVPEWAVADASKAPEGRKLEGMIAPGVYDVKPGWDARTLLSHVLETSTTRLQAAGLPDAAGASGFSPYEVLVIASLIEREAVKADFEKVSRVIYNRLDQGWKLEMDSTVNYVLDRPAVRTSAADRAKAGPYNTYAVRGLPPTPISAPSKEAIIAAEKPADGDWMFFVKCEENGLSCFSTTLEEHQANVDDAIRRGVF
nr:endolytic transglycosylase MltG [Prauserella shujinwangii]